MQLDVKALGSELAAVVAAQVAPLLERIKALEAREPVAGPPGKDGEPGKDGKDAIAEKGTDGIGLAGAMIDREGALLITMTNGEVKNLGPVVGKDGSNGKDGADGLSFDSFDMEYLAESHEISVKASVQGRVKEIRYDAGGIRPKGYWTEGTKAKTNEAWTEGGTLWIALKETSSKPGLQNDAWMIAARKGRDGEKGRDAKAVDNSPIKLGV